MTMEGIQKNLGRVTGPTVYGDYIARCPAPQHHDQDRSLLLTVRRSPRSGKQMILMCCLAGCRLEEILAGLPGIKKRDLIVEE